MVFTRSQHAKGLAVQEAAIQPTPECQHAFLTLRLPGSLLSTVKHQSANRSVVPSPTYQKTISGRVTKETASSAGRPPRKSKRVASKDTQVTDQQTATESRRHIKRPSRSLKVKLTNIRYDRLPQSIRDQDYKVLRHQKRISNYTGQYLPPPLYSYDNRYQFVFGHNPFSHTGFQGPTAEEQWHVYKVMKKDLKENFNKDCFLDQPDASTNDLQSGPMHMSDELTVDNLVKVILSISTENSLAIRQHAQLCSKFTYTVGGREVKGVVPNYHKMRTCPAEELVQALNVAGYQNMRQKAFHTILREIYDQNVDLLQPGEVVPDGNPAEAADFVPGLLSMEYLKGDGLTKQQRFDMLVKFDQIAVKTGCCLLAFNLKIPIFVVDTHVHHMTRNLQWIPGDCHDADKACMFLDNVMPSELKFGLHQAFWHHRINCARCMPRANPKSLAYQQRMCPLEGLIKRDLLPLGRSPVRNNNNNGNGKTKSVIKKMSASVTTSVVQKEKKLPGTITFLRIHYKVAEIKGYALRKVEIDDNFGDGSRQNKDKTANFYWGRAELTHANDIVKVEDALEAVGITEEAYEARFVKKKRVVKGGKGKKSVKKVVAKVKKEIEFSSDSDLTDLEDLEYESLSEFDLMDVDNEDDNE